MNPNNEHLDKSPVVEIPVGLRGLNLSGKNGKVSLAQEPVSGLRQAPGLQEPMQGTSKEQWPAIIPFSYNQVPDFPSGALPEKLRNWVVAEAEAVQTPVALPAMIALSACGFCLGKRVEISPFSGHSEPCNVYCAVILPPGSRKSAVFAHALKPLYDFEQEWIAQEKPTFAKEKAELRIKKTELERLEKEAGKKEDSKIRALALAEEIESFPKPFLPRMFVENCTTEKLETLLAEQDGKIFSTSSEGGVFELMKGRYTKGGDFDLYLKGHSRDNSRCDRISREGVILPGPCISIAYTVQPQVIEELVMEPAFRGKGLLARFLYAWPDSNIGKRKVQTEPVSEKIYKEYALTIRRLWNDCWGFKEPKFLGLEKDALARFLAWCEEIELELGEGKSLDPFSDWGAKLAGATLRIAGIFHCLEFGPKGEINKRTIENAVQIARYLIPHAERVLTRITADGEKVETAQYLWRRIQQLGIMEFSKRELHQRCKGRITSEECDLALAELESAGYIRTMLPHAGGPGRPPGQRWQVNPFSKQQK